MIESVGGIILCCKIVLEMSERARLGSEQRLRLVSIRGLSKRLTRKEVAKAMDFWAIFISIDDFDRVFQQPPVTPVVNIGTVK